MTSASTQDPQPAPQGEPQMATKPDPGAPTTSGTQQDTRPTQPNMQGACLDQLWILVPMILVFYFLLIRPQQKQEKARQAMLAATKKGDRIVTTGGIHGTILQVNDTTLRIRLDDDGRLVMTVDRAAVARVIRDEAAKESAG